MSQEFKWDRSISSVNLREVWLLTDIYFFFLFFFFCGCYRFIYLFIFHLFLAVGDQLLYNIVVAPATHWHESAMDPHVFPTPIDT